MKERSLVAFTLLSQMAIGAFWVLGALRWVVTHQQGCGAAGTLTNAPQWVVSVLMLLALTTSFLHLGAPLGAWRVLANLRSSWLSREVLLALLFAGASVLVAGLYWFGWGTAPLRHTLYGAAAILGLALLVSMANAYRLRTVPAWDSWVTPVAFLTTALLLGGSVASVLLGIGPHSLQETVGKARQWLALGTVVLLGVELLIILLWISGMSAARGAASRAAIRITQQHGRLFRARLALIVAAILASGAVLAPWGKGAGTNAMIALAFALTLTAEVLGRLLFYEARVRHGV